MQFLKVRSIPTLFWSSPKTLTLRPPILSTFMLIVGLSLFGLGEAFLLAANFGVSPWTVLAEGLGKHIHVSVGTSTFIISSVVLIFWWPLKQTPGLGTILNIVIVALVIDCALPFLPQFEIWPFQVAEAAFGVLVTGIGGAIYLIANLGPGPRDGIMTGLQRVTGYPLALVRNSIELSVVCLGWLLGGTVGLGTLLFAFGIGPCIAITIRLFALVFPSKSLD